ncbi:MAG: hypothetical protein WBA87_06965 [Microbacterium sp.]
MNHTLAHRLTMTLPLLGVAFVLASMLLPVQLAAIAWAVAMASFVAALTSAIVEQRRRTTERSGAR